MANYLDERAAAELIGCSVALMRKLRQNGEGPAYYKIGRLVRYAPADIQAYLDAHRVTPGVGQ